MKKSLQFLCATLMCTSVLFAQTDQAVDISPTEDQCGFNIVHQRMMESNPSYAEKNRAFNEMLSKGVEYQKAGGTIYRVPVVVHVMHLGEVVGTGSNISEASINQGIRQLNERFRKVAGSLGDGNGVDVEIEFALAVRDPAGNCTNGIVRFDLSGDATYAANGVQGATGSGITDAALKAYSRWTPTSYYNIYLISEFDNNNCGFGVQGYAYFAGSHGSSWDGMVQLGCKFAVSGNSTLTHELGHAFNLYHTFEGDGGGGSCPTNATCASDGDRCCDTPPHRRSSSDCVVGTNACTGGTTELHIHNYMDYSSDACQSEFTADQEARMSAAMVGTRGSYLETNGNLSLVPPAVAGTEFTASSQAICLGTAVSFYDESTCIPNTYQNGAWTGITFSWTFDDGVNPIITSTLQNPTIAFTNAGTYSVSLSVTNSFGTASITKAGFLNISAVSATAACVPTTSNTGNFGHTISNVSLNTILSGTSTSANVAYTDYSCTQSTSLETGSTYSLSVTINAGGSGNEEFEVYIDYNNDGTLAAGEMLLSGTTASNTSQTFTTNITIPTTATTGTMLRMRVVADANGFSTPCGNHFIGDTEDYGVYLTTPVVLPIELVSFDANLQEDDVVLTWVTTSEFENDYFTVERSINGTTWEDVVEIDGAGTSQSALSYTSIDRTPYLGRSYYRLRQTDFNGEKTYSAIRAIDLHTTLEVSAYPNPFAGQLNLSIYSDRTGLVTLNVINLVGQTVAQKVIQLNSGDNNVAFDLSHVNAGAYLVRLNLDHTRNKFVRVIKQ